MALLFRLESAADPGDLLVVTDALSAWFRANPAPESLRLLFVEFLRRARASFAPGTRVPQDLLEVRTMLVERRFGVLSTWVHERVAAAETAALDEWGLRVMEPGPLDDVFA
jgi:hypothetical protein